MQDPHDAAAAQSVATIQGASDRQAPDGLTSLHLAVIKNDRAGLRGILSSREHGVDERTSEGATPLMMACLFGRASIFLSLVRKKASIAKKDHSGLGLVDYVRHLPPTENILSKYHAFTGQQPSRSGRQAIYAILQACTQASRSQQRLGAKETRAAETVVEAEVLLAAQTAADEEMETVFLRDGGELQISKARVLKSATFEIDLGRKSCGAIRGKDERHFRMIAISGWRGDKAEGALCNKAYSASVRRICAEYGLRLPGNWLDNRFRGHPSERVGAFASCHAEKLLGIWILEESIFHMTQTKALTKESINNLKLVVDQLPSSLRDTVIELDHEPCVSCIDFLKLIHEKAGLRIEWQPRKWFTRGTRPRLQYANGTRAARPGQGADTFEDEIDEDYVVVPDADVTQEEEDGDHFRVDPSSPSSPRGGVEAAGEAEPPRPDLTPVPSTEEGSQRARRARRSGEEEASSPSDPYSKHASPVREWPPPPVAYRAKKIRTVSSAQRRALLAAAGAGAGSWAASTSEDPASPPAPAPAPAPGDSESRLRPLQFSIPIQLTTGVRSPPEELDPAILDDPVAEPFPGASELRWSFSSRD